MIKIGLTTCSFLMFVAIGCSSVERPSYHFTGKFEHNPEKGKWFIELPAIQQVTDSTCGAALTATFEKKRNKPHDELEIGRFLGTNSIAGTTYEQMTDGLSRLGYAVHHGTDGSVKRIRENLEKGLPTILEWVDWGGHWVAAVGYDTRGTEAFGDDVIIFSDPADIHDDVVDGFTYFNAQRFEYMWIGELYAGKRVDRIWITAE